MSITEKLQTELEASGLWPDEAKAVIEQTKADESNKAMQGRWDEDVTAYPPTITALALMSAKRNAKDWLEKNAPRHWALPMFA